MCTTQTCHSFSCLAITNLVFRTLLSTSNNFNPVCLFFRYYTWRRNFPRFLCCSDRSVEATEQSCHHILITETRADLLCPDIKEAAHTLFPGKWQLCASSSPCSPLHVLARTFPCGFLKYTDAGVLVYTTLWPSDVFILLLSTASRILQFYRGLDMEWLGLFILRAEAMTSQCGGRDI